MPERRTAEVVVVGLDLPGCRSCLAVEIAQAKPSGVHADDDRAASNTPASNGRCSRTGHCGVGLRGQSSSSSMPLARGTVRATGKRRADWAWSSDSVTRLAISPRDRFVHPGPDRIASSVVLKDLHEDLSRVAESRLTFCVRPGSDMARSDRQPHQLHRLSAGWSGVACERAGNVLVLPHAAS